MRRSKSTSVMALAAVVVLAATAAADDLRPSLAAELGWAKFRVTGGRLQIVSTNLRESQTFEAGNPLVGGSETMRLNVASGAPTLKYELKTRRQRLSVDFDSPYSVVIERTAVGDKDLTPVKFVQPREGDLKLTIGDGPDRREISAASIWHLMLLQPEAMAEHVLPMLYSLRPGWPIEDTAAGIEHALVQIADSDALPDRTEWAKLVEQLGSGSFAERRKAERLLRSAGPAVVVYLKSLPLEKIDAERRARIERLLESLSSTADDTPGRIAVWLVDDPLIWTTVLASDEPQNRAAAKKQLEKLLGRAIEFDVDGEAAARAEQVERLRKSLP